MSVNSVCKQSNRREICCDTLHDLVKTVHISKTLPPHPFTEVAFNHLPMSAVLSLVPLLCVFPTVHNVLCACTGVRINEVLRVAHLKVSETYGLYATIHHPHIRHDDRAWQNRLLDDRQPDRSGTVNIKSPLLF